MKKLELSFRPTRRVKVVDVVIAGDVLRVVLDGAPDLRANNAVEALQELRQEHDEFRRFIVCPPRGNERINACLLLPPYSPDTVSTAIIAPQFGYAAIAGTPLMAAAAVLIETGQVPVTTPQTRLLFDTAKGKTQIVATIENGRCTSAQWTTVCPQLVVYEQPIKLSDGRTVPVTLVSPGLPYAVVRAKDLHVECADTDSLSAAAVMLSDALAQQFSVDHIHMAGDATDYHVMIVGDVAPATNKQIATVSAACVSANGWVWSTPAGTGALSVARFFIETGALKLGQALEVISPAGFAFPCRIDAAGASVTASATIVASSELVLDPLAC